MSWECQERGQKLTSMLALIFETGSDIFLLPRSLVDDIHSNDPQLLRNEYDETNIRMSSDQTGAELDQQNEYHSSLLVSSKINDWISCPIRVKSPGFNGNGSMADMETPPLRTGIRFVAPPTTNYKLKNPTITNQFHQFTIEGINTNEIDSCSSSTTSSRSPIPFHSDQNSECTDEFHQPSSILAKSRMEPNTPLLNKLDQKSVRIGETQLEMIRNFDSVGVQNRSNLKSYLFRNSHTNRSLSPLPNRDLDKIQSTNLMVKNGRLRSDRDESDQTKIHYHQLVGSKKIKRLFALSLFLFNLIINKENRFFTYIYIYINLPHVSFIYEFVLKHNVG